MGRWLLEVDHGREVARWSSPGPYTGTVGLGHSTGTEATYAAGLDLDEEEVPEGAEVSIAIDLERAGPVLTLDDLDRLEGAPGLLRRVLDDGATVPFLRGIVTDLERGTVDEPVTFSLASPPVQSSALIPDPTGVVSETTWPVTGGRDLHAPDVGRVYPRIIGQPGTAAYPEGSPAILAEADFAGPGDTIIISDGRVGSTTVTISCPQWRDAALAYSETLSIVYMQDLAGKTVGTVTATVAAPEEGQTFYAGWGSGGGMLSPRTGLAVRGWAEVVEAILGTGYPVDVQRLRGEAHFLDRFLVDLYWDEPTLARDLVEDLLAMIPGIRTMRSEKGEWWRAPSWLRPSWQAVDDIVIGRGATRRGPVRTRMPDGGLVNDITVDYARTVPGGCTGRVRVTAADDPLDSRVIADPRCARSQARHGVRSYTAEIPTWDRGTAELHASGVLGLGATARRGVAVEVRATPRSERLAPGDVVSLTDPALGWSDLAAEVEGLTLGGSTVKLDLTVL